MLFRSRHCYFFARIFFSSHRKTDLCSALQHHQLFTRFACDAATILVPCRPVATGVSGGGQGGIFCKDKGAAGEWRNDIDALGPLHSSDVLPQVERTLGTSQEDAFGETDVMAAICGVARNRKSDADIVHDKSAGEDAMTKGDDPSLGTDDAIARSQCRRRKSRARTVDKILGEVLHDALRLRDMGHKPTADFVYKRTQERIYEEEHGRKAPGKKENAAKYIPFPPDFHLHRLLPLNSSGNEEVSPTDVTPATASTSTGCYTKNAMHEYRLLQEDPWPARAIVAGNLVWTRHQVSEDKRSRGGMGLKEWEERMFSPREGYDLLGELADAMDELRYWEEKFLRFLRATPLAQRRTLPFLHEWHRILVHRLIRAERRYARVRDDTLAHYKASTTLYKRTEELVDRVQSLYAEAHRSLASPNYDPFRMKKSTLAPFMRMTDAEFAVWSETQKHRQNIIIAELA